MEVLLGFEGLARRIRAGNISHARVYPEANKMS